MELDDFNKFVNYEFLFDDLSFFAIRCFALRELVA